MSLQALKIVQEEFARWHEKSQGDDLQTLLDQEMESLEQRIVQRISKECIDQPEPRTCAHCGAHTPLPEAQICSQECGGSWVKNHPDGCAVCGREAAGTRPGLCSRSCDHVWFQLPSRPLPLDLEVD